MSPNEALIRRLYQFAEVKNAAEFVAMFTADGYFYDVSAGKRYYGEHIADTIEIYASAFPDMHRELHDVFVAGDVVTVELSLNGTHDGPLALPSGTIPATGREMQTPCCDVFRLKDGKVKSFHCFSAGTILLSQLGVFG